MGGTMTAEPVHHVHHPWPVPPQDGYTVDDLFTLPDLPPHTELIDGSLVFVSPQRNFHTDVIDMLVSGLRQTVPSDLRVKREMTVIIDKRNGPEPDISVVRAEAVTGPDQSSYRAADVLLAVEVVSPDSESRDRDTKPRKYAAAGIPNFWRVERSGTGSRPVVHVYTLDPQTNQYIHAGMHRDTLKVDAPYDMSIDLAVVDHL
ncbi:Uma2 family endonuclease [Streptomyces sp. NPDC090445]|uniref:Uma2 family endonuclease n=1 Tax=Streptomyces sp. NPDC090445 TaxID=3365963 RepID=UPI00382B96D3